MKIRMTTKAMATSPANIIATIDPLARSFISGNCEQTLHMYPKQ